MTTQRGTAASEAPSGTQQQNDKQSLHHVFQS